MRTVGILDDGGNQCSSVTRRRHLRSATNQRSEAEKVIEGAQAEQARFEKIRWATSKKGRPRSIAS
jgi:hypothetical protein